MILFFGYLNYGNFGDDLLLELAREDIQDFKTLSSKNSIKEHFSFLTESSELVLLGGLFQDQTSLRSSFYYATIVLLAKLFGKKINFLATGIGPLENSFTKSITKASYQIGDKVSVRDKYSSDFLKEAQIKHQLVPDLALDFNYDETKVDKEKMPSESFDIISINPFLSPITAKQSPHTTLEIICEINQKPSTKNFIYTKDFNPHELIYLLRHHCKSLVTQRFHLAILAKLAGIEYSTTNDCHKVIQLLHPHPGQSCSSKDSIIT